MKKNPSNEQLHKRMAHLEFIEDQLSTELAYIDNLLRGVGFPHGLLSVKEVARDIIQDKSEED